MTPTAVRNGMNFDHDLMAAKKVMLITPDIERNYSWERMMVSMEQLMRATPNGIVLVVDSLDGMMTQSETAMEADDGGSKYGGMAKANSNTFKRVAGAVKNTNSLMIVIQQARDKIAQGPAAYGPPQITTSGGHAVKHYSKIRMKLARGNAIKKGDDIVGHEIKVRIEKNKYHRPFVDFVLELRYDYDENFVGGLDRAAGLIDVGIVTGVVERDGASHTFHGLTKKDGSPAVLQGRERSRQWLLANPEIADELERQIRAALYGS